MKPSPSSLCLLNFEFGRKQTVTVNKSCILPHITDVPDDYKYAQNTKNV